MEMISRSKHGMRVFSRRHESIKNGEKNESAGEIATSLSNHARSSRYSHSGGLPSGPRSRDHAAPIVGSTHQRTITPQTTIAQQFEEKGSISATGKASHEIKGT